jgi:MoxR-like ATPase
MQYTPHHFNPAVTGETLPDGSVACDLVDTKGRKTMYVYDPKVIFAINVAMASHRPLLLAGEPGSGKTSVARNAARVLRWPYYEQTISSRTQASDLVWEFDSLQRLNDAYHRTRHILDDAYYVVPGKLWWAMDPVTAERRGMDEIEPQYRVKDPVERVPGDDRGHAVVLLDEIDKADPDVPNDLLEVLDRRSFHVKDKVISATRKDMLIILSTNGERELPGAFVRRCVTFRFPDPTQAWFTEVANRWYGAARAALHSAVAAKLMDSRRQAREAGVRQPGTAEYLDAVSACHDLGIDTASTEWQALERCVFRKQSTLEREA